MLVIVERDGGRAACAESADVGDGPQAVLRMSYCHSDGEALTNVVKYLEQHGKAEPSEDILQGELAVSDPTAALTRFRELVVADDLAELANFTSEWTATDFASVIGEVHSYYFSG